MKEKMNYDSPFTKNLKAVVNATGLSDTKFCDTYFPGFFSKSKFSKIKNGFQDPTAAFVADLTDICETICKKEVSMKTMLYGDISEVIVPMPVPADIPVVDKMKYSGIYSFFYLSEEELKFGIMVINEEEICAVMNLERSEAKSRYDTITKNSAGSIRNAFKLLEECIGTTNVYRGNFTVSRMNLLIQLEYKDRNVVRMCGIKPPSDNKLYKGGKWIISCASGADFGRCSAGKVCIWKNFPALTDNELKVHLTNEGSLLSVSGKDDKEFYLAMKNMDHNHKNGHAAA